MKGTTHVFAFFIKYSICECVFPPFPPSTLCLIISSSCLCLPSSIMMTRMARLPQIWVPTLMSACLTPLLSAQVSPHPCPCDLQCPPWLMWRRDRAGSRGKGDSLFSFFLHCLSLFMTSPAWPGTWCDPRETVHCATHWWQWLPRQTQSSAVAFWLITRQKPPCPSLWGSQLAWSLDWMKVITEKVGPWGVNNGYIWEKEGLGGLTH